MKAKDVLRVNAFKADGTRYRSWEATVEAVSPDFIVTVTPAGHIVKDLNKEWASNYSVRTYFWYEKPFSLLEVYLPDGELHMIYVNINSPIQVDGSQLWYTDFELDVVWQPPGPAFIVDEDEFAQAVLQYGYSAEHQRFCYRAAAEALDLANQWKAHGIPVFEKQKLVL